MLPQDTPVHNAAPPHEAVFRNDHTFRRCSDSCRRTCNGPQWMCTDQVDVNDFEFKRRVVYHHGPSDVVGTSGVSQVNSECQPPDELGNRSSCDLIGGGSEMEHGDWEYSDVSQLRLGHIRYLSYGQEFIQAPAVKLIFEATPPETTGLYRYEYEVCAKTKPLPTCSPRMFSGYDMEGTDRVPYSEMDSADTQ